MAKMFHNYIIRKKRLATRPDTISYPFDQSGLRQIPIAEVSGPPVRHTYVKPVEGTHEDPAQTERVPASGRTPRLEPPLNRPLNLPSGPSRPYGWDRLGTTAAPPRYVNEATPEIGRVTRRDVAESIVEARGELAQGNRIPAPAGWPHGRSMEAGVPGTGIFSGFIGVSTTGEFNPDMFGWNAMRVYEQMRRTDADVACALFAMKLPLFSVVPEIFPGESNGGGDGNLAKEIAAFVRENLFGGLERQNPIIPNTWVSQSFDEVKENAFLMLDFGCAAHENLWRVDGDRIRLRYAAPRLPHTFYRFWTAEDGETLSGLEQLGYRRERYVSTTIPANDLCLFVNRKEGSNFWGISALRAAYQHWYTKALSLTTPIPTPNGWTTMGNIQVGQQIFGGDGKVRNVVSKSEIFLNKVCYRLTFSNGASIVAGEDHRWYTETISDRKNKTGRKIRTTKEIVDSLKAKNGRGRLDWNHRTERAGSVMYPEKVLPIDPYLLGLWLGDGSSYHGTIACDAHDVSDEADILKKAATNLVVKFRNLPSEVKTGCRSISVFGLKTILGHLGMLGNKHIPVDYLVGSVEQRWKLVAGLMDSDGTTGKGGVCSFSNTNHGVINTFVDILRSLGESPRVYSYLGKKFGKIAKQCWHVNFSPLTSPFLLPRKTQNFNASLGASGRRTSFVKITSAEIVSTEPLQCISVDDPNQEFLVSRSFQRTCNSHFYRIDAIAMERNGMGIPWIKFPPGAKSEDIQKAQQWVEQMAVSERTGLGSPRWVYLRNRRITWEAAGPREFHQAPFSRDRALCHGYVHCARDYRNWFPGFGQYLLGPFPPISPALCPGLLQPIQQQHHQAPCGFQLFLAQWAAPSLSQTWLPLHRGY